MTRIAVLDEDRCRPKHCGQICYRFCPQVRMDVEAIQFENQKALISESLCVGCGICIKKCPFTAIHIVNLPDMLEEECSHQFGANSFRIFRLPTPSPSIVLGLLGQNGTGKTTALKILSGETKINLGDYENPPDWREIIQYYRGSSLQGYFQRLSENDLKVVHKPQYVDKIPQAISGEVKTLLNEIDERNNLRNISKTLQLDTIADRSLDILSGGELQKVAIAATICREADVYLLDEPSSYLDVEQRLLVAKTIKPCPQLQQH